MDKSPQVNKSMIGFRLIFLLTGLAAAAFAVGQDHTAKSPAPSDSATITPRARAIHDSAMVVDTHADTPQRFLDGRPFSRRYQIENVLTAANGLHQPWRILECVCSEETAKQRLETENASSVHRAGNRDYKLYLEVRARFEAITMPKTVIDTDQPLEACVRQALAALR